MRRLSPLAYRFYHKESSALGGARTTALCCYTIGAEFQERYRVSFSLLHMDAVKTHRLKLNRSVRTLLGRQLRLYYGILASDIPPRFREMLRELDDQSPKVASLNARR